MFQWGGRPLSFPRGTLHNTSLYTTTHVSNINGNSNSSKTGFSILSGKQLKVHARSSVKVQDQDKPMALYFDWLKNCSTFACILLYVFLHL